MTSAPTSHDRPQDIVLLARAWIGTPYHHQASARGIGTDCLGLIRGLYREIHGREAAPVPGYSRDWAEASGSETMLEAAQEHLAPVPRHAIAPGDVLIFRWRQHFVAKHAAILATTETMIHAAEGAAVAEVAFTPWWRRRLAGAFAFPGTRR